MGIQAAFQKVQSYTMPWDFSVKAFNYGAWFAINLQYWNGENDPLKMSSIELNFKILLPVVIRIKTAHLTGLSKISRLEMYLKFCILGNAIFQSVGWYFSKPSKARILTVFQNSMWRGFGPQLCAMSAPK